MENATPSSKFDPIYRTPQEVVVYSHLEMRNSRKDDTHPGRKELFERLCRFSYQVSIHRTTYHYLRTLYLNINNIYKLLISFPIISAALKIPCSGGADMESKFEKPLLGTLAT